MPSNGNSDRENRTRRIERLVADRRFQHALPEIDAALVAYPRDPRLLYVKTLALFLLKWYQEVLDTSEQALPLQQDSADKPTLLCLQGAAQFWLAHYEEALEPLRRAIALQPESADAWMYQGSALRRLGHSSDALEALDRALAIYGARHITNTTAIVERAELLIEMRRYPEALEAANEALALEPKNLAALRDKVQCLEHMGRAHEALDVLQEANTNATYTQKARTEILAMRAHVADGLGQATNPNTPTPTGLERAPVGAAAWMEQGLALEGAHRAGEALEAYNRVLELEDTRWLLQDRRAQLLEGLKRHDEALTANARALELASTPEETAISNAQRAGVLLTVGRRPEALVASEEAIAADPSVQFVWLIRIRILVRTGHLIKTTQAIRDMARHVDFRTRTR